MLVEGLKKETNTLETTATTAPYCNITTGVGIQEKIRTETTKKPDNSTIIGNTELYFTLSNEDCGQNARHNVTTTETFHQLVKLMSAYFLGKEVSAYEITESLRMLADEIDYTYHTGCYEAASCKYYGGESSYDPYY